ncbi:MAG TPA: hypothetical protein VFT91_00710 [Dehalococcoidia bacterium]|nr:hypothetical protein [Dehalococcoidia bacterium]
MTANLKGVGQKCARRGSVAFWGSVLVTILAASACAGGTAVENPASQQTGRAVRSMQLLTPAEGWALTDQALKWTNDGGLKWTDISPPSVPASAIKGLFFLDAQRGWIVAPGTADVTATEQLVAFRTSDGGRSWAPSALGLPDTDSRGAPAYVNFADPGHGWVVVKSVSSSNFSIGDLFRTADGGITWTKLSIPIGDPVRFANASDGWTAGGPAGDKLYVTRDGGDSWQAQTVAPPPDFQSSYPVYHLPVFTTAQEGVLPVTFTGAASGVVFYITRDGGKSWTFETSAANSEPLHLGVPIPVDVVDASTWVAALSNGARVFATRDGGRSFREVAPNGMPAGVFDIDFTTGEIGWALVQTGECPPGLKTGCTTISQLLETTDAGQTWTTLNPQ